MGNKYSDKVEMNENPPPGYYDPEEGVKMTRSKSFSAFIKEESGFKVWRGENPDAGDYEPNKGKEGREMGNIR